MSIARLQMTGRWLNFLLLLKGNVLLSVERDPGVHQFCACLSANRMQTYLINTVFYLN